MALAVLPASSSSRERAAAWSQVGLGACLGIQSGLGSCRNRPPRTIISTATGQRGTGDRSLDQSAGRTVDRSVQLCISSVMLQGIGPSAANSYLLVTTLLRKTPQFVAQVGDAARTHLGPANAAWPCCPGGCRARWQVDRTPAGSDHADRRGATAQSIHKQELEHRAAAHGGRLVEVARKPHGDGAVLRACSRSRIASRPQCRSHGVMYA